MINWDVETKDGQTKINHATLKERRLIPKGYGHVSQTVYKVLTPGFWREYEMVQGTNQEWRAVLLGEGATSIDQVPLIYYSLSSKTPFYSDPPLLNTAEQNLTHYQLYSDYYEVLHHCNLPVPVRKGIVYAAMDEEDIPPLILGPHALVDLPPDGDFYYREPTGAAIAATESAIANLETSMDRALLSFLSTGEAQKTATEILIHSAQTEANLFGMGEMKESNVEQMFDLIAAYYRQDNGGTIHVNKDILRPPITPEQVALVYREGIISHETAVEKLAELGAVDDPVIELKRVEQEKEAAAEAGRILMEAAQESVIMGTSNATGNESDGEQVRQADSETGRPGFERSNASPGN